MKRRKWVDIEGTNGFSVTWLVLMGFSLYCCFSGDWKIGTMGFIILIALGFLGMDMIDDIVNPKKKGDKENEKRIW